MLRTMRCRHHLKWIVVLALIGAAINLPLAVYRFGRAFRAPLRTTVNVFGAEAGGHKWPGPKPEGQPDWPAPTQYVIAGSFGYRQYNVLSTPNPQTPRFQMEVEEGGWPLACLSQARRYWPQNDPAWKTKDRYDIPLHLSWAGVLLNPLAFALSSWALLFGIPAGWSCLKARSRKGRNLCTKCAYPLVASGICPECGATNAPPTIVTAP
jgi:hypothetical protein